MNDDEEKEKQQMNIISLKEFDFARVKKQSIMQKIHKSSIYRNPANYSKIYSMS